LLTYKVIVLVVGRDGWAATFTLSDSSSSLWGGI